MSRRKVDDPKTARTSLSFKQSELDFWKKEQLRLGFKSFSDFVRTCIKNFLGEINE